MLIGCGVEVKLAAACHHKLGVRKMFVDLLHSFTKDVDALVGVDVADEKHIVMLCGEGGYGVAQMGETA